MKTLPQCVLNEESKQSVKQKDGDLKMEGEDVPLKLESLEESESISILLTLPVEIWKFGICKYLELNELKNLRLCHSLFRLHLTNSSMGWQQCVPFHELKNYEKTCKRFDWPLEVIGIFFTSPWHLTNSHLQHLPLSVTEMDLRGCRNLIQSLYFFLPRCIVKLILPMIQLENDVGLLELLQMRPDLQVEFGDNSRLRYSCLYWACAFGNLPVVRYILRNPRLLECSNRIDDTFASPLKYSPLFVSANNGHVEIVEELLKFGVKPDHAPDQFGFTPLLRAVSCGRRNIVELLIKHGANLSTLTRAGKCIIQLAETEELRDYLIQVIINNSVSD